jgi:SAM-dependent methyltransferase
MIRYRRLSGARMRANPSVLELQETLYHSRNPTRRWLHCSRRDWIVAALKRHRPEHCRRAMEVGPGSGVYLRHLLELAPSVVALDIDDQFLGHARKLAEQDGRLEVMRADITSTGLPGSAFDLILCSEVVEHIADSLRAIRQIRRLLRPGGLLVLSTPHKWSTLELVGRIAFLPGIVEIVRWIYGEAILETGHINLLTRAEIERQLCEAGFEICERHAGGLYVPILAEFFGSWGLSLEESLERRLRDGKLEQLLWTQYYVAKVPH